MDVFAYIAEMIGGPARRRKVQPKLDELPEWRRNQLLRQVGVFRPVQPAPPRKAPLTSAEQRARRTSTRAARARADRAAKLAQR